MEFAFFGFVALAESKIKPDTIDCKIVITLPGFPQNLLFPRRGKIRG
jgi:hypothetical protein